MNTTQRAANRPDLPEHTLTTSDLLELADPSCKHCMGSGCGNGATCDCIARQIFNACFGLYSAMSPYTSRIRWDAIYMSRPAEEYKADFMSVARRALLGRPDLRRVFDAYVETDGDALDCLKALKINQGAFFRHLTEVRRILGGSFREVRPYALFPTSGYFARPMRTERRN
jgi:hypothetical protein